MFLDEIGKMDISPENPNKFLHSIFDNGSEDMASKVFSYINANYRNKMRDILKKRKFKHKQSNDSE